MKSQPSTGTYTDPLTGETRRVIWMAAGKANPFLDETDVHHAISDLCAAVLVSCGSAARGFDARMMERSKLPKESVSAFSREHAEVLEDLAAILRVHAASLEVKP